MAWLVLAPPLALAGPAVHAAPSCDASQAGAPVSLFILKTGKKVRDFARSVKNVKVLRHDRTTVVFEDGRVVTSDVESASHHLNALGWGTRKLQIVASFPRRPSGRRAFG